MVVPNSCREEPKLAQKKHRSPADMSDEEMNKSIEEHDAMRKEVEERKKCEEDIALKAQRDIGKY